MSKTKQLRSGDIPQADTLRLVRRVVDEIRCGNETVAGIVESTGFSERHVQYRIQTARILQLIDAQHSLTEIGGTLLHTTEGSPDEAGAWRQIIPMCATVKAVVPRLLDENEIVRSEIADRIQAATGLSRATAERRTNFFLMEAATNRGNG